MTTSDITLNHTTSRGEIMPQDLPYNLNGEWLATEKYPLLTSNIG
jgi:hypothetical protein